MNLLNWPSSKNLQKVAEALNKIENEKIKFIKPAILARYLNITQSEASFILETAERADIVKVIYNVNCPNCHCGYKTFKYKSDIDESLDICEFCFKENLKIHTKDIEKVYVLE